MNGSARETADVAPDPRRLTAALSPLVAMLIFSVLSFAQIALFSPMKPRVFEKSKKIRKQVAKGEKQPTRAPCRPRKGLPPAKARKTLATKEGSRRNGTFAWRNGTIYDS